MPSVHHLDHRHGHLDRVRSRLVLGRLLTLGIQTGAVGAGESGLELAEGAVGGFYGRGSGGLLADRSGPPTLLLVVGAEDLSGEGGVVAEEGDVVGFRHFEGLCGYVGVCDDW